MRRRNFLKAVLVGAVGSLAERFTATAAPENAIVKISELRRGRPRLVEMTRNGRPLNLLVTRLSATKFSVLDATCTHQGCVVRAVGTGLLCKCHTSRFKPGTGGVISGPAPAPLAKVKFSSRGGYLYLV